MTYRPGDQVWPGDLPRRFLCRVAAVESFTIGFGPCQVLELDPLEGPWPVGTSLIRLDSAVVPARTIGGTRLLSDGSATAHTTLPRAPADHPARGGMTLLGAATGAHEPDIHEAKAEGLEPRVRRVVGEILGTDEAA